MSVLSSRVKLLDHVQVDHIEGRLTSMLQKLSQIGEKKGAVESSERAGKVRSRVATVACSTLNDYTRYLVFLDC